MAKLSQIEKYTIQGALHSGKTPNEIAKLLNRTEKCVQNYVDGELDKIHTTIAKVQTSQIEIVKPDEIVEETPKMIKPDLTKVRKLPKGQAKLTMARTTAGGKPGVAVMTSAASQVGDEFLKEMGPNRSRTARGHIYNADGELVE